MQAKEIEDFEELLEAAELNAISDWDMEFAADMRSRYFKYKEETYVSENQLQHLERIAG
jgi:hypothetical protein